MDTISLAKAGSGDFWIGVVLTGPEVPQNLDLILRSSRKAARQSVDVMEYWKGEIVLPSVRITHSNAPISEMRIF
jgi:hypothetical protein